jgi:hypothetical protein
MIELSDEGWDGSPKWLFLGDELKDCPDLFHYTSLDGLRGIIASQQLWATHYADLNDSSEVVHIRLYLREAIIRLVKNRIIGAQFLRGRSFKGVATMDWKGEPQQITEGIDQAARELADYCLRYMYFTVENDARTFFLTSFCSHPVNSYEYENGLLSQWRGYGSGGGYCIVFDGAKLWDMLRSEYDSAAYFSISLDRVEYATRDFESTNTWKELAKAICDYLDLVFLEETTVPATASAVFLRRACFLKHQGFSEEQEVRIVAMPTPKSLRKVLKMRGLAVPPLKRVCSAMTSRRRRHIRLFEDVHRELPIKKVIVGPSTDMRTRISEAQQICEKIKVVGSNTPFIG